MERESNGWGRRKKLAFIFDWLAKDCRNCHLQISSLLVLVLKDTHNTCSIQAKQTASRIQGECIRIYYDRLDRAAIITYLDYDYYAKLRLNQKAAFFPFRTGGSSTIFLEVTLKYVQYSTHCMVHSTQPQVGSMGRISKINEGGRKSSFVVGVVMLLLLFCNIIGTIFLLFS